MSRPISTIAAVGSLVVIAVVVGGAAAAFAYTAGWFSPDRLTPSRLVAALAPPGGPALGHRRNHAKGICFTGRFEANGPGSALSVAPVLAQGSYPVVGRFNLGTPDPMAVDGAQRVRGIGLQVTAPDGQQWRMAMIDLPFFPVATPDAFYELLVASGQKDKPDAMKALAARHPEIGAFGAWAARARRSPKATPRSASTVWTASCSPTRKGPTTPCAGRCCPPHPSSALAGDELAKRPADFLEREITQRVSAAPQRWTMAVQVANPGDPVADPSKAWPDDRRTVQVGTLMADKVIAEPDGPCRDINFDPTVLPQRHAHECRPVPGGAIGRLCRFL